MDTSDHNVKGRRYHLTPIGIIRSPFMSPKDAPRQGKPHGTEGTVELFEEFRHGLHDLEGCTHLILLYWMDKARRDLLSVTPPSDTASRGVFSTRSPHRPNPIGLTVVELMGVDGLLVRVRGVDAADGTPLLDIKPYVSDLDSVPHASVTRVR